MCRCVRDRYHLAVVEWSSQCSQSCPSTLYCSHYTLSELLLCPVRLCKRASILVGGAPAQLAKCLTFSLSDYDCDRYESEIAIHCFKIMSLSFVCCGLDDRRAWFKSPGKGKILIVCSLSKLIIVTGQFRIHWEAGSLSPGVKRPWPEGDHLPTYSAEVNDTWIYTRTLLSWCSAYLINHRDNFILILYVIYE